MVLYSVDKTEMLTLNHVNNNIVFCVEEEKNKTIDARRFRGKGHTRDMHRQYNSTEMAFRKTANRFLKLESTNSLR